SDLCVAAVSESARSLLAGVQAARESAHDDDVVEVGPPPDMEAEASAVAAPAVEDIPHGGVADEGGPEGASDDAEESDEGGDELAAEAPGYGEAAEDLEPADEDDGEGGEAAAGPVPEPADEGTLASKKAESLAFAKGVDWEDEDDAPGAGDAAGGAPVAEDEAGDEDEEDEGPDEEARDGAAAPAGNGQPAADGGGTALHDRRERRRGGRRRGRRGGRNAGGGRSGGSREPREMPPIQDILQKGQEIVVQVIKDGIGTKGPTLTTFLSIPGRYVVLMPGIGKRGVSRKVTDNGERERLKSIVRDLAVPPGLGFIVRTAGSGATREDLQRDLDYLLRLWEQMKVRIREHSAPVLLYQENDLVIRTLRDLYDGQGEVIIDDRGTLEKARQFMSDIMPQCVDKVRFYDGERPLFTFFNVEGEIAKLLEARIELRSGGYVIIEQTEALVAIDVNSGRFKNEEGTGIDATAFAVNSEAAIEVARQIRLRDLGGVVVVDFIDMRSEKHRKALEQIFKDALRRDRARIKVARFSPFGIIELTRQRVRPSLKRSVHQRCPYCTGTGYIPSDETSCLSVIRAIRDNLSKPGATLVVTVRPEVAEAVLNTQRPALSELERESHKQIFIRGDHRLAYEDVEIRPMVTMPDDFDHRRA
ncbi:MAG TPA: Rne/Rng family ribonuclease, partial [Planctomycetota bacterium]|nr:Rne/Rng family ribonuclease [Planctomycetota bacterium]